MQRAQLCARHHRGFGSFCLAARIVEPLEDECVEARISPLDASDASVDDFD
jgi:hypothetical protein